MAGYQRAGIWIFTGYLGYFSMIREHLGVLVWVVKGRGYVWVYLYKDVYITVGLHLAWFGNIRFPWESYGCGGIGSGKVGCGFGLFWKGWVGYYGVGLFMKGWACCVFA